MSESIDRIQVIDLKKIDIKIFKHCYVGCIILTKDKKILLQQRGSNWHHFPGFLSTFGGRIESDELPIQTLMRELHEELGAQVKATDVISIGTITEQITKYNELIYAYFWYDKHDSITGCYEGEAKYFDSSEIVLKYPKVMDDICWMLLECRKKTTFSIKVSKEKMVSSLDHIITHKLTGYKI